VVVLSSLKVTATEVAVAQLVLEDLEVDVDAVFVDDVDVLSEAVAADVELFVPDVVVSCWYMSLN
jgi:hypothetical protein